MYKHILIPTVGSPLPAKVAESLGEAGHEATLCCLQDAALLASDRASHGARSRLQWFLERGPTASSSRRTWSAAASGPARKPSPSTTPASSPSSLMTTTG